MSDDQSSMNPYAAPTAALPPQRGGGNGTFDIAECIRDGWRNTTQNFMLVLGVGVVGFALTMASYFTIIGIFLLVPIFAYGATKFLLEVHDGRGEFSDLFAGFRDYGSVLAKMLVWMLIMLMLSLVGSSIQYLGLAIESDSVVLGGALFSSLWSLGIMIRFYWAPFFIVEEGMGGMEATRASWEATGRCWFMLIALSLLTVLIVMAGALALIVGLFVAVPMSYLMFVSSYRQAVGGPESSDARAFGDGAFGHADSGA